MSDHIPNPDGSSEKRQKFSSAPPMIIDTTKNYTATMVTSKGTLEIVLDALGAPTTVNSFVYLARWHYYDGIVFHRVIPDFMAQTGDPTGTGTGGSDLPDLKAEFSDTKHVRGTCSMARSGSPHSANSQFFICFADAPWLDRQYSAWGQVVEGMEHVDAIKKGGEHNNGMISGEPDKIVKMRVGAA
jgi:cyclophilin family peptidyl-prolyl cis-trans isomerase